METCLLSTMCLRFLTLLQPGYTVPCAVTWCSWGSFTRPAPLVPRHMPPPVSAAADPHRPPPPQQVAQLGVPYVLMHMRGDPTTMQAPSNLNYDCVWRDVGHALQARADEAMACGIAAWNLVLDPGAGTDVRVTCS